MITFVLPPRSSITRLSVDDKALRSKEDSSQERDQLHKATAASSVPETIPEKKRTGSAGGVKGTPVAADDGQKSESDGE